jgi:Zn-dependent protease with chaperone function
MLNLVFPSKKNLIIGLGLVNRLNLTEFKAVLAHEFGHFSQNSMKLGSYVYTANRVVADVVYGRDGLDDMLAAAQRTDIRIAIFAWIFGAGLWVMRKGLDLLFRGINFAHASLSRQMEYNADLVAASVTGSDSLVFALARLDLAGDSLGQAWTDLTAAADHGRFTRDFYYHQTRAAEFLRIRRNDPTLGEVPELPEDPTQTVQVFKPEDTSVPKMWATHPSNHDREVNAKQRYFRGPIDERSPWLLIENPDAAREAVTRRIYEVARKVSPAKLEEPEAIQAFIDAEHAETTYHPRYRGLYENRYIKPGDIDLGKKEMEKKVPMTIFTWEGEKEVTMSPMDSIRHYLKFLNAGFLAIEPSSGGNP